MARNGRALLIGAVALLVSSCSGGDSAGPTDSDAPATSALESTTVASTLSSSSLPSVDAAEQLPGVDERTDDGDLVGSQHVLEEAALALLDSAGDGSGCPVDDPAEVGEPVEGQVRVVVTSVIDGCFRATAELVASGQLDARIAELEAVDGTVSVGPATTAVDLAAPWDPATDPDSGDQWFLHPEGFGLDVSAWDALEQRQSGPVKVALVELHGVGRHDDLAEADVVYAPWSRAAGPDLGEHSTHVAGIVAATAGNGVQGRGLGRDVQILSAPTRGASMAEAIWWSVDEGAQVINISACEASIEAGNICRDEPDESTAAAIEYARRQGVLVFAAAGNCGVGDHPDVRAVCEATDNKEMWPAAYPRVLAVGGYERTGERGWFSTANRTVDISAPGGDILSTAVNDDKRWSFGTSMAAPMVSAAAAVLVGHRPDIEPGRILSALFVHADDAGPPGWDTYYGAGRVNPIAVAQHFESIEPWSPPSPIEGLDRSTPEAVADVFMASVIAGDEDIAAALEVPDLTWSNVDFYRDLARSDADYSRPAACPAGDVVAHCWWEQDDGGSALRMRLTEDGWAVWYPFHSMPWWYEPEEDIELCVVGDDAVPARSGFAPNFPVIDSFEPGACGLRSFAPAFDDLWVVRLGDTDDDVVYVDVDNLTPDESAAASQTPAQALAEVEVPSLCRHPAGVAVNGTIPTDDPNGSSGFWDMILDEAVAAQLDDDPGLEYATRVSCSAGGVSWPDYLLLYDDDVSLFAYFSIGDLFPHETVWRGGISGLEGEPILGGEVGFEESGVGRQFQSYFSLDSFGSYPCVIVGDLDTGDPYPVNVESGVACGPGGSDIVEPGREIVDGESAGGDPVGVLTDYFLAAGARDYTDAWSMLSPSYQGAYGSYDSFVRFWDGIDTVGIDSTSVTSTGSMSTVTADVWFRRLDGSVSAEVIEVDVIGDQVIDYRFIRIR